MTTVIDPSPDAAPWSWDGACPTMPATVKPDVTKRTGHLFRVRYANEIGNCYRCNRTLTDEESRRRGIGPVCVNL